MLNIQIICLGKLKESYWKEAETEYLKRLNPYAKIKITEIPEESFTSAAERQKIQEKEAEKIKKYLEEGTIIALHERGKEYTSTDLAAFLERESQSGAELRFIIGGPLGLHPSLLTHARHTISLSKLTFPHQMVRTILLEQLYRAVTISKGKPYHY